jgi:hypothetical protein
MYCAVNNENTPFLFLLFFSLKSMTLRLAVAAIRAPYAGLHGSLSPATFVTEFEYGWQNIQQTIL